MIRLFTFVALCSLMVGCAFVKPQGPIFKPHTSVSNEKALIYVYRPLGESFGYDRTYYLFNGEDLVIDLKHGGYYAFEVDPGKISLISNVNDSLRNTPNLFAYMLEGPNDNPAIAEFEALKSKTYYVRFKPISYFTSFEPTLSIVTESEGLSEIKECKLILKAK